MRRDEIKVDYIVNELNNTFIYKHFFETFLLLIIHLSTQELMFTTDRRNLFPA